MMNYVPWRLVKSWSCRVCGNCSRRYAVNLTWKEHRKIGKFWPDKVRIKEKKPYLGRKINGTYEFLSGKLCRLQMLNIKPFVSKIWPFRVLLKLDKMDKNFDGLYQTHNKEYFIYLNPACLGINNGNPIDLNKTVLEVIRLRNGIESEQYYSTSREFNFSQLLSTFRAKKIWDQILSRRKVNIDLPMHL